MTANIKHTTTKAGGPRHLFAAYDGEPEVLDESKAILQQFAPRAKDAR
ncbi:MAG: hypothetical protein QOF48_180 [Verrucomicrobiota bacterium]|jgi:hypothetical protein